MRSLLVPIIAAALAAGLAIGVLLGRPDGDHVPVALVATTPAARHDPSVTFDDLLRRAQPDEEGRVALSVTEAELTAAANNELPPSAPVDAVDLGFPDDGDAPTIEFSAELRDSGLDVTGAVALALRDGRIHPALVDPRAGPLPLRGSLRAPVEDVLDEARAFFAALSRQGVEVTRVQVGDGRLDIAGQTPGPVPSPTSPPVR